jgi:hypothetical protein
VLDVFISGHGPVGVYKASKLVVCLIINSNPSLWGKHRLMLIILAHCLWRLRHHLLVKAGVNRVLLLIFHMAILCLDHTIAKIVGLQRGGGDVPQDCRTWLLYWMDL